MSAKRTSKKDILNVQRRIFEFLKDYICLCDITYGRFKQHWKERDIINNVSKLLPAESPRGFIGVVASAGIKNNIFSCSGLILFYLFFSSVH